MGSHEQQLRNPRYRDWVKAGLALKYLKDGIEEFVDDVVKDQLKGILEDVGKEIGLPGATCDQCPVDILLPAHVRGSCGLGKRCFCYNSQQRRTPCPNDVCGRIFDKLVQQHMYGRPSLVNTDSTKWCTSHWEIAKCFLDGGGYEEKVSAADTDCKGLLSIITNNMFIQKSVDTPIDKIEPKTDVFSKSKEARNEILHLASLQLSSEKLINYVDVMIQLLGDRGKLHKQEQAKLAISKLTQLKETDLIISTEDEWEIRESALKAVQEKKQMALEEIEEKQKEIVEKLQIEQLQEALHELSKTSKEKTQSLSTRQESLEHRQTLLESTMKQLQGLQSESSKKILILQKGLSDLKTTLNGSDEIESLHKQKLTYLQHKKDLKEELYNLYSKHLSIIPEPPLLKALGARVDDFYMELKICDHLLYESRSNEDTKHTNEKIVNNYHDIFFKENKRAENIYVLGVAGVGKSTWCLKLINSWLQGNTKQDAKSTNEYHPNEILMLEFDIVLFVSLRHASKEGDLIEMIHNQILNQTPHFIDYMQEILKTEPEKCLVLVDGLDEWNPPDERMSSPLGQEPSFPGRKGMNHCTVLTTTRPWKLGEVRPSSSDIDRAVIISGLKNRCDIRVLAERVLRDLNNTLSDTASNVRNKTHAEKFVNEVKRRFQIPSDTEDFPDVMKIPLIVIFMVLKWFKDGSLESSMAGNYSSLIETIFDHEEGYRNLKAGYGKKQKYGGRLSSVSHLEQAKTEWSKGVDMLPQCVKKRPICVQYSGLILKLCKIAFEGLFESRGNTLIFSEEMLLQKLCPEDLEVSVKSGILSKANVIGSSSFEMSKLSFLHKTVQEYMAAIYLVAYENDDVNTFQIFKSYCITRNKIREMENVILFVCGMDTVLATKLLKHVAGVEPQKISEINNGHNDILLDMYWYASDHSLLKFLLTCIEEIKEVISEESMRRVPLNAFILDLLNHFEDILKSVKNRLSDTVYIEVAMYLKPEKDQEKITNALSPGNFAFSNLTKLSPKYFPLQWSFIETKTKKFFEDNLKFYTMISGQEIKDSELLTKQKCGRVVLDLSDGINIDKVEITMVTACKIQMLWT